MRLPHVLRRVAAMFDPRDGDEVEAAKRQPPILRTPGVALDGRLRPQMDWRPDVDGGPRSFDEALAGAGMTPAPTLTPATRPRVATPPEPAPPPSLYTGPTTVVPPELPEGIPVPALPGKQIGVVGLDVDPATAGMGTRPRVARPLEYRANRVREMETEPPAKSHHGRLYEAGAGAWRGFQRGGIGGALMGLGMGAVKPDLVARDRQQENLERERGSFARLLAMQKAQTGLEGEQIANQARAATIPYLLARPELEQTKIANKKAYDAWRMSSGDRKADTAEEYVAWRMANGDRRATTAEGLAELRAEYVREIQPQQFERRQGETERHNVVTEALGGERNAIAREGLSLRDRIATGNLDASWARIGQGYERMDEGRRKEVDALAEKAAKALAEANYFAGQPGKEAEAELKRTEAGNYRRGAEAIAHRPAPRVARPAAATTTPPVSIDAYLATARERLGDKFNEAQAREAYRRRYGR